MIEDASFPVDDLPAWMDRHFPMFFVALGAVACVATVVDAGDANVGGALVLIGLSVSPWALSLAGLRMPDPVFAALVIAPIGVLVVFGEGIGIVDLDQGGPQLVMMLLVGIAGQIGTIGSDRVVRYTTAAAFGVVVAGAVTRGDPFDYMPWIVGILLGVGGGRAFRANVVHVAELRAAQQELADRAVAEERRRIAREVHDLVAHTMSVTMLHLTAARLAVRRDPAAAEEALAEAERHGRSSMDDIRSVVQLLRTDEPSVTAALPDDDLTELVDRYRSAGSDVQLCIRGPVADLPPAVRLAVHRVVQESLSNAVRHGREPIDVAVRHDGDAVALVIVNGRHAPARQEPGPGAGVTGMRERVEALGGRFRAGPAEDGSTWRVDATIPS